jgi:hypothetical protein
MLTSDPRITAPINLALGSIKTVSSNWGDSPLKGMMLGRDTELPFLEPEAISDHQLLFIQTQNCMDHRDLNHVMKYHSK